MFEKLFKNELSKDEAKEFLSSLYKKGESSQDIATAAKIMREHSIKLPVKEEIREKLIDIVGTGGDKSNSFNVSSTVALLLASLGSFVAKHGNRSVTSKSGSADMLRELGINIDLDVNKAVLLLEKSGFTFIYAKNFHPSMAHIMPIRKELNHRTIFNILGPLTNPAEAKKYLLGVFDASFIPKIAAALRELNVKRALVVSSADGMDEISISAPTKAALVESGCIKSFIINPKDYGFNPAKKEDIVGGDAKANAAITKAILSGELRDAKRDMVLLNAGAALMVDGKANSIHQGIKMAKEAIESGRAIEKLNQIIKLSWEL